MLTEDSLDMWKINEKIYNPNNTKKQAFVCFFPQKTFPVHLRIQVVL